MRRILFTLVAICGAVTSVAASHFSWLGPNVHIYGPQDNPAVIAAELDSIHTAMRYQQFSFERHAVYFLPGDYTAAGTLNVPYYMSVAGLGRTPYDVRISNIDTPTPNRRDGNALVTFWRSIENFYVVKSDSMKMCWGVSQAAPMRRVVSERMVVLDNGSYASGGFNADCIFLGGVGTRHQQQWYMRNSRIETSLDPMSHNGWNYGFQGVTVADTTRIASMAASWTNDSQNCNITLFDTTPVVREKPFLFLADDGDLKVFVPSVVRDAVGVSYTKENMGSGAVLDLHRDFYIAMPGVTAAELNRQLRLGKNIFFTPGIYELEQPLMVKRRGAVIMGTGLATLVPGKGNTDAALIVDDNAKDVIVSSLMFDALYSSTTLLRVGKTASSSDSSDASIFLFDIFCRVGGMVDTPVNADVMVEINHSGVVADHFWLWRADHGSGVGWQKNTCKNGLIVNGNNVTIYGLFNEHAQEYQTIWNGENGRCYFYQSETPYDVPSQDAYISHDGTVPGYASYKVADNVKHHFATMMGVYDVFIRTGGVTIETLNSVEVPDVDGVKVLHLCNFGLSQSGGGFKYIINNTQSSTYGRRITRWYIDRYGY